LGELNDLETAEALLVQLVGTEREGEAMLDYAARRLKQSEAGGDEIATAEAAYGELIEAGRFWRSR